MVGKRAVVFFDGSADRLNKAGPQNQAPCDSVPVRFLDRFWVEKPVFPFSDIFLQYSGMVFWNEAYIMRLALLRDDDDKMVACGKHGALHGADFEFHSQKFLTLCDRCAGKRDQRERLL